MKKTGVILLFTLIMTACCYAQQQRRRIVPTLSRNGYQYIPQSVFADSVDGILGIDFEKAAPCPKNQMGIWWGSFCNDGEYILTITPEKIYFHSGHENPNPNFLYWTIEITPGQYNDIATGLRKKKKLDSANGGASYNIIHKKDDFDFPKWWKDGEPDSVRNSVCDKSTRLHLEKYFTYLNKCIPKKHQKLVLPPQQELDKMHLKYFSRSRWEIEGWLDGRRRVR